jgi:hypothetical protein
MAGYKANLLATDRTKSIEMITEYAPELYLTHFAESDSDLSGQSLTERRYPGGWENKVPLSCVYFIQSGRAIKIGYAANPLSRLAELQIGNPEPLVLLGAIPGGATEEGKGNSH